MTTPGFLTIEDLHAHGYTRSRIRAEIALGLLERVIRGWCCRPGANREAVKAMRLGGRLTCVSALKTSGPGARRTAARTSGSRRTPPAAA